MITRHVPPWIDTRNLQLCDATGPQQNSATSLTAADDEQDFVTLSLSDGLQATYYGPGHDPVTCRPQGTEARELAQAITRARRLVCPQEKQLLQVTDQFLLDLSTPQALLS